MWTCPSCETSQAPIAFDGGNQCRLCKLAFTPDGKSIEVGYQRDASLVGLLHYLAEAVKAQGLESVETSYKADDRQGQTKHTLVVEWVEHVPH